MSCFICPTIDDLLILDGHISEKDKSCEFWHAQQNSFNKSQGENSNDVYSSYKDGRHYLLGFYSY